MGKDTLSMVAFTRARQVATAGGTRDATHAAEERVRTGLGLDPLVDPKGLAHLGPVRMSLPRFEQVSDLWRLTVGLPMAIETLLDTTGSMGSNVELAFTALPKDYAMLTEGDNPILGRYDVQIATAIFNDVEDGPHIAVLARSQFEMAEKIAQQMAMLPPGKNGCGNGKEDPQFGLFGGAYLTQASINRWGLKYYHFTISDEPVDEHIDLAWLKQLFGDDVLERAKANGWDLSEGVPRLPRVVKDLQKNAHAFFLQVGNREDVRDQWTGLYGTDHYVNIGTTTHIHFVKAAIIALTEGVIDLSTIKELLVNHGLEPYEADAIIRAVAHIPLGAQTLAENFAKIPMAGDFFREKSDLWPVDPNEVVVPKESPDEDKTGADWL